MAVSDRLPTRKTNVTGSESRTPAAGQVAAGTSLLLALMASGFNGQRFAFHGYLPVAADDCKNRIALLEKESQERDVTQIFIETPYRNDALLKSLLATCHARTRLCIASDLTLPTESIASATVEALRKEAVVIGKRPAVFLLYAR